MRLRRLLVVALVLVVLRNVFFGLVLLGVPAALGEVSSGGLSSWDCGPDGTRKEEHRSENCPGCRRLEQDFDPQSYALLECC